MTAPDEHLEAAYEDRYTDDPSEDPDDPFWDDEDEDDGQEGDGGWEAFASTWEPDTVAEARGDK